MGNDENIFDQLWEKNINAKSEYEGGNLILLGEGDDTYENFDVGDRNPYSVFKSTFNEETEEWNYLNPQDVDQIITQIPALSDDYQDKIKFLFDRLPFWLEKYRELEEKMFQIDPDYVIKQWKGVDVLISLGSRYHRWTHQYPDKIRQIRYLIQPTEFSKDLCQKRLNIQ